MRLFRSFQAFTLEKSISWDGLDENGNPASDGAYTAAMWILAGSNQRTDLEIDDFVVDTQAPAVSVTDPDPSIFSPNDDDSLDELTIVQSNGSVEDLWTGSFTDQSGRAVKTYSWTNDSPDTIVWDGTDDGGTLLDDGTYSYSLVSTDRAGNAFSYSISNIELNTVGTPLTIEMDNEYFSPNNDGVQDSVEISLDQDVDEDIVSWKVAVNDSSGVTVRTFGDTGDPPEQIVFDGMNDAGSAAAQGEYRIIYSLKYRNGNNPGASAQVVIDTTPPVISADIDNPYFSPNGDGIRDTVSVRYDANEVVTWEGEMTDRSGRVLASTTSAQTTTALVWDGTDLQGNAAGEGTYYIQADFADRAGNTFSSPRGSLVIDLTPPTVTFALDKDYFSPDRDGIKDTVTASFTSSEPVRGQLSIKDAAGRDMGTLGGLGRAVQPIEGSYQYVWNGVTGSGLYIPDGTYSVGSVYEDLAGNRTRLADKSLTVDTRTVRVTLDTPKGFSPNGDGKVDNLIVEVDALFYDSVESWKAEYVDATGSLMNVQEGTDTLPTTLSWNGGMRYAADVTASEGRYSVELEVTYLKGNTVSVSSTPFFVDVTPPAVSLQATADPFAKANGESMEGDLYITMRIEDAHEVADWSLDVLSPSKDIVRSFTGTGDLEDQVVWKGERERVSRVPVSEQVILRVTVADAVGNETVFEQPVPLDLLVVRRDGKLYLLVPNVIFGAYKHALDSRGAAMFQRNMASIERVKEIFDKYTAYDLMLEGHALNIYRGDAAREADEEEILVPLTERRANTVRDALINEGMDPDRIDISWYGGTQPIVNVFDLNNRWKNRRVEFIMIEK
jgi:flagellar hook assembly protein FlgD